MSETPERSVEERLADALRSQEVVGLLGLVPPDLQEGITLASGFALDFARAILAAAKEHGLVIGEGRNPTFEDLLTTAETLLENYPPDSIVCSHRDSADLGARTVAAIADLVNSCRVTLRDSRR